MAIEVFTRYESKFVIDRKTVERLEEDFIEFAEPDAHNQDDEYYTIGNIYYDTDDNDLIRNSLAKPAYKEKLRLRGYGVPTIDSTVYLEIKKKFRGKVNKRRSALVLEDAYRFLETGVPPLPDGYMNRQVLEEIEYILRRYAVRPKLYLAYDRRAYFGRERGDLRITFDSNIRTRRYDLALEAGDYGDPLLDEELYVMEVKTAGSIPYELARLFSELKVFSRSFSKYGREYRQMLSVSKSNKEVYTYA